MIFEDLVSDVDLLCLDAGNTIVFLDHDAVAKVAREAGFSLDSSAVERAEGEAKRRLEAGPAAMDPPLPDLDIPPGWGALMRTIVRRAGALTPEAAAACVRVLWRAHREFNLWRRLPADLIESIAALRATGVPVCVVSNSEGRLHVLFEQLGIHNAFDLVLDSDVVGIEKPDPGIFRHALAAFGVAPARALHLGDIVAVDVVGARAAGLRAGLIDPYDHYAGRHPDVPRVASAAQVARAIASARASRPRSSVGTP